MVVTQSQTNVSPLDALVAHFTSSSKSVQRAFAKYIIDISAEDYETAKQQKMLKLSLTQAFKELREGEAHPVEDLFEEL